MNLKFSIVSKVLPSQGTTEDYNEVINQIVALRFELSHVITELDRFRQISTTRFNIQSIIICLVLAYFTQMISGYKLSMIFVYTTLLLPGLFYNRNRYDIIKNNMAMIKPFLDQLYNTVMNLYNSIVNKQQPIQVPSQHQNIIPNNNINTSSNATKVTTQGENNMNTSSYGTSSTMEGSVLKKRF
ncbi:hypothetical protein DLAC_09654 [Tieghemostelium lacteum]|uniref:RETREG1-3/ARL6IP-like N-terminal reticulon-homology domain-containing protein n=1 Tax=Tieghemostelium lacteum TaxID=361077 RepID=A0A151Z6X9_TIELA|nr:hypothetical protein DLAC_09654 [Tieghemostelium lacteum]|eukprot:KYQ89687.1 hypothetical protein DLAC_09654 [Tieghemostelium lacteum]